MHVWYVDAGIEDTLEPIYTHCLVLSRQTGDDNGQHVLILVQFLAPVIRRVATFCSMVI